MKKYQSQKFFAVGNKLYRSCRPNVVVAEMTKFHGHTVYPSELMDIIVKELNNPKTKCLSH